jgi:hypothetical protein
MYVSLDFSFRKKNRMKVLPRNVRDIYAVYDEFY